MKLDDKHREALARLSSSKDYQALTFILRTHMNNCMVSEFKYPLTDVTANAVNKSYYQGQVDLIKMIIKTVDSAKKRLNDVE